MFRSDYMSLKTGKWCVKSYHHLMFQWYQNIFFFHFGKNLDSKLCLKLQVASIRRHSLQVASASNHPTGGSGGSVGRGPGVRYLRAKYTAGSMAGLGFSMAILGLCVGIFLGFLLWKRRIGLPYYLSPWHSSSMEVKWL